MGKRAFATILISSIICCKAEAQSSERTQSPSRQNGLLALKYCELVAGSYYIWKKHYGRDRPMVASNDNQTADCLNQLGCTWGTWSDHIKTLAPYRTECPALSVERRERIDRLIAAVMPTWRSFDADLDIGYTTDPGRVFSFTENKVPVQRISFGNLLGPLLNLEKRYDYRPESFVYTHTPTYQTYRDIKPIWVQKKAEEEQRRIEWERGAEERRRQAEAESRRRAEEYRQNEERRRTMQHYQNEAAYGCHELYYYPGAGSYPSKEGMYCGSSGARSCQQEAQRRMPLVGSYGCVHRPPSR